MKTIYKILIASAVASIIAFLVMIARNIFVLTAVHEIMRALCDGFFVAGILFLAFGLLVIASNGGTFDMIKYGFFTIFTVFTRDPTKRKYRTFYDYRKAMREQERSFGYLLIVGGIFLAIAIIFLILYYQFEPEDAKSMLVLL